MPVVKPYTIGRLTHLNARSLPSRTQYLNQARRAIPLHVRFASSSQEIIGDARSLSTRIKNLLLGTTFALVLTFGYYYATDTRAGVHQWLFVPSLRRLYDDAEEAHEAGVKALKTLYAFGLHPRERGYPDGAGDLRVEVG